MARDILYREAVRQIERLRMEPWQALVDRCDGGDEEFLIERDGQSVALSVRVRSSEGGGVRIEVSAFLQNWWRLERVDESLVLSAPCGEGAGDGDEWRRKTE